MKYEHFLLTIENHIARVSFNRPEKSNALHLSAWEELQAIFEEIDKTPEARVAILSGEGKHFCSGIDLELLMSVGSSVDSIKCDGRRSEKIKVLINSLQDSITAIEKCRKPVLAAIHKGCIGGAVDIIAACDMRYCTQDAYFTIKEIDMGMVADLGTLQRLPKIISPGLVAEMAYTGRNVGADEAAASGLVNKLYSNKEEMMKGVEEFTKQITAKSPLSIRGTKEQLLYARDHSVDDGLKYMQIWNAAFLLSDDLKEAFRSSLEKRPPKFEN